MKKKQLLLAIAIAGAMAMGASATTTNVFDQWTFTSAKPQVSDIQGKKMANWNKFRTTLYI